MPEYVPGRNSSAYRWVPNWLSFWVLKTVLRVLLMVAADWLGLKM
jgi:hypothetical protein